uniref:Nuclear receptor subfamily 0, group B, member 1 n=1 Tax=Callorhinchus milii TaxID=7868 RepID=A0A4W3GI46_CALMI
SLRSAMSTADPCGCGGGRRLSTVTRTAASAVLAKSAALVGNAPRVQALPPEGPRPPPPPPVRGRAAPLLVPGLARDPGRAPTPEETPPPGILQRILTDSPARAPDTADSAELSWSRCWRLDISGWVGLQCVEYIQSLHDEARQALNEHVKSIYRRDQTRFINLIIAVSMLRSISAGIIVELFLRPIGDINIDCMLMEMLLKAGKEQDYKNICWSA